MIAFLGIIAGILAGVAVIPYVRDILRHTTKPERASWLIWLILSSISFFSQLAEGGTWSVWLTGIDTLGILMTFILAVKYGVGGLTKRDVIALIFAGIGLVLWYLTRHAFVALFIAMVIDALGAGLTVIKTYEDPMSETFSTWLLISIAAVCSMISVDSFNIVLLAYPFYLFLANFSVVVAILLGKKRAKIKI